MEEKYSVNIGLFFSEEDQKKFLQKTFAVLGCGGQGGYVATYLARLGVKKIILFDGDIFEESNLNRQIGAKLNTLGKNKAQVIKNLCEEISDTVEIIAYDNYFGETDDQIESLLKCDYIFDEMDYSIYSNKARQYLRILLEYDIPISSGGNTIFGSMCSIITKDNLWLFDKITKDIQKNNSLIVCAQPAYLCAITGGLDVLNMVKFFTNKKHCPIGETFYYDFFHNKISFEDKFGLY